MTSGPTRAKYARIKREYPIKQMLLRQRMLDELTLITDEEARRQHVFRYHEESNKLLIELLSCGED